MENRELSIPIELKIENKSVIAENENVSIIGTGNYGISLGKCLMEAGFHVTYGSRKPDQAYLSMCFESCGSNSKFSVTNIADAFCNSSRFVFMAVSANVYESVVEEIKRKKLESLCSEKIVVDISNQIDVERSRVESNAEHLQKLLLAPEMRHLNIFVIKGFNLISAYTLGKNKFDEKSFLTGGLFCLISSYVSSCHFSKKIFFVKSSYA